MKTLNGKPIWKQVDEDTWELVPFDYRRLRRQHDYYEQEAVKPPLEYEFEGGPGYGAYELWCDSLEEAMQEALDIVESESDDLREEADRMLDALLDIRRENG